MGPERNCDVVVAGGGTAGLVAAVASARCGARTALIESKGYVGGIAVEGGTALHSYYNLWKAFPGVEKRQVVQGIPLEIVDRLSRRGGTSGHAEMTAGYDYDSVCTAIDTELYKLIGHEMLAEAGVQVCLNTLVVGAERNGNRVVSVATETHSGRETFRAAAFVDATGYGDLCAHAGAEFSEPNDYPVANSIGVGGVDIDRYEEYLRSAGALREHAAGVRSGVAGKTVRVSANQKELPSAFRQVAEEIGMASVTTTVHDGYFMFIKLNYKMAESPTNRDAAAEAELELRKRQARAIELFRSEIPGCERAFVARSSPCLCIRRGRCIRCDYDVTSDDVLSARHFNDEIMVYGFHDSAPRLQIANGGTYGIPYRAITVSGLENLYAVGMMITSNHDAHMSTRNTVSCMGQGQGAGTAAGLCATRGIAARELEYAVLRAELEAGGVYFEP